MPLVEEVDQHQFEDNLTTGIVHACLLGLFQRSCEQYGAAWAQVSPAETAISGMKADLDRSAKDREATVVAKQKAEEK